MTLDNYRNEYEARMAQQGIKVTWAEDGGSPYANDVGGYKNPDNWVATLSRDGVSTTTLVTLGRIQITGLSPEQLADQDMVFALQREGQLNSPQGQLPSPWFQPNSEAARRQNPLTVNPNFFQPEIPNPGPPTTVLSAGRDSLQPHQSPAEPNVGTKVTSTPSSTANSGQQFTFWQWNYFWEEETRRSGPPPEEVGVPSGTTLMTGPQWVTAVGNWYGVPVHVPSTTPTSTVGGTPTVGGGGTPPVGGSGTPAGGGTSTGGTHTPVGEQPPTGGGTGPEKKSFWTWNALKEQTSGIVGDDPAHYNIQGSDLMTFADWAALTSAYYASKGSSSNGDGKPKDDMTLWYIAAGIAFAVFMSRRG